MIPAARLAGRPAVTVAQGASDEILGALRAPGCAAAIWQRRPDPLLHAWLDSLPPASLPAMRATLPVGAVAAAADLACQRAGMSRGGGRDRLCADIAALARKCARLMQAPRIALRLDVVRDNACRRFHLDHVPARMLCTYRGQGTEYGVAGPGGQPAEVHRMAAGWAGIFRGRLWPGTEPCGLVHRSPPIEGRGEARLLLVIDAAEEP